MEEKVKQNISLYNKRRKTLALYNFRTIGTCIGPLLKKDSQKSVSVKLYWHAGQSSGQRQNKAIV